MTSPPFPVFNGRIDHLTDLLNDLLNRYYKYRKICE